MRSIGPECVFGKLAPMIHRGLASAAATRVPSSAQRALGLRQIALQHHCRAIVERMRQRRLAVDPLQADDPRAAAQLKNGEPAANGYTAEPKSCRNPGSVSGNVRAAPPGSASASKTSTRSPACASTMAAASPFGPDPITHARLIFCPRIMLSTDSP